jgi:hypothetical protein
MKKGSKKKSMNLRGREPFEKKAKKPSSDVKPLAARPAAHGPREAARAKRTASRMKRLEGVMI